MSRCQVTGLPLWLRPKNMGEEVRILDPFSRWFNRTGFKFANRLADEKVLVYFPKTKVKGYVQEFDWKNCKRVEGGQI